MVARSKGESIPSSVPPLPSPPVLLALIPFFPSSLLLPCTCPPFRPGVRGVMDGITTGTRPESRGPGFVIGLTCPSRIISIPCRSNQEERLGSKTRQYGVHTTNTGPGESRALLFLFPIRRILRTLVRLLFFPTSPSPCLQLFGPWFMEKLRLP